MGRLREWKDSNGQRVSSTTGTTVSTSTTASGFKKRFNKLIKYYEQHLPKDIDYISVNLCTKDTLDFTEYYRTKDDVSFNIYIGPTTEAWRLKSSVKGKLTDDLAGQGWPELLRTLRSYITVPVTTTLEYKELLTEWLDASGKKVSSTASIESTGPKTPDQTDRYKSLLAQIDSDGFCKYTINLLDSDTLDITLKNGVNIKLERQDSFPIYKLMIEDTSKFYDDYEDVLKALIEEGIIGDTDLCESASIAEDFRLYENLWD